MIDRWKKDGWADGWTEGKRMQEHMGWTQEAGFTHSSALLDGLPGLRPRLTGSHRHDVTITTQLLHYLPSVQAEGSMGAPSPPPPGSAMSTQPSGYSCKFEADDHVREKPSSPSHV